MAVKYENSENVARMNQGDRLSNLSKSLTTSEKKLNDIIKRLNELEKVAKQREQEAITQALIKEEKESVIASNNENKVADEKVTPKKQASESKQTSEVKETKPVETKQESKQESKPIETKQEAKEVKPIENKPTESEPIQAKLPQADNQIKSDKQESNETKQETKPSISATNSNANQVKNESKQESKQENAQRKQNNQNRENNSNRENNPNRDNKKGEKKQGNKQEGKQDGNKPQDKPNRNNKPNASVTTEKATTPSTESSETPAEKPINSFIVRRFDPNSVRPMKPVRTIEPQKPERTYVSRENRGNRDNRDNRENNGEGRDNRNQNRPPRTPNQNNNQRNNGPSSKPLVAPIMPQAAPQAKPNKNFGQDKKKSAHENTYIEKDKEKKPSKRTMVRQSFDVDDYDDDDRAVYVKQRKKGAQKQTKQVNKIESAVVTTDNIPIKTLSEKLGITAVDITKRLFKEGIITTINDSINYETALMIALDLGIELEYKPEKTAEQILSEKQEDTVEEIDELEYRAPVVTVMGHVDHGKTSLLDYIRKSHVTDSEAGGITQHIGAYSVDVGDKKITFIDTPGHEAFTAMRARGAQITDIVILVVAADDGIMPQTVEAINHSKAAGVTIIVAVNKMDKPSADIDRVKQSLTSYGLIPEEWGGETIICPVSAKTGEGVDGLLESVLLVAEMKELMANPKREARGSIIEARLDKGMGAVASVLVQNGTLRVGDNIMSGMLTGRVRAMMDDRGKQVKAAGPSMAVSVLGLEGVPNAGDSIYAVTPELMKQVIEERKRKESEDRISQSAKISLDDIFGQIAEGNMKTLNIIIKGDVQGSVEAIKHSVVKLSNEEVNVNVIHSGAGAVTETDVMLAESSKAIILAFNVRPDTKAKALAERNKIDIRTYRIIYDLLDDIEAALKGMLTPKYQEIYLGKCEVRQTFKITGVGVVAGCYVTDGKIIRGGKLRIYRDNILVVEGNVQQLKRFKDDVKEVSYGFECGCAIEGFNEIQIGDMIECYIVQSVRPV